MRLVEFKVSEGGALQAFNPDYIVRVYDRDDFICLDMADHGRLQIYEKYDAVVNKINEALESEGVRLGTG